MGLSVKEMILDKVNVISFSGGRTSAYLIDLMEGFIKEFGGTRGYIYMDTGAEHPNTYKFIREVEIHFNIKITCLRLVTTPLGKSNKWETLDTSEIKQDLKAFKRCIAKYSTPTDNGAPCTDQMKSSLFSNYCIEKYGKGNFTTWLGIREDEPRRLFGKKAYKALSDAGFEKYEMTGLFKTLRDSENIENAIKDIIYPMLDGLKVDELRLDVVNKIKKLKKINFRYMAEISDFAKTDVLSYWASQSFDLDISEWLGNCVFCIKKGVNKVGLATIDEPEMAQEFIDMIESDEVRTMPSRNSNSEMYRGALSLRQIRDEYKTIDRDSIIARLRSDGSMDSGSCSESCEVFNDQIDLF